MKYMTGDRARRILENSKRNSVDEKRLIIGIESLEKESGNEEWIRMARKQLEDAKANPVYCYLKVGGQYKDIPNSFVCWPYSDEDPVEDSCAFVYGVFDNGSIKRDDAPLNPGEARQLYRKFFPAGTTEASVTLPETNWRTKSRQCPAEAVA